MTFILDSKERIKDPSLLIVINFSVGLILFLLLLLLSERK